MSNQYEVGYGKPPSHSQFKKGQSGNRKGRPKGNRNFKTDVQEALQTPVRINSGGRPRTVSTQEAALLRLREKALKGNERALDRFLALARLYNDDDLEVALTQSLAEEDATIFKNHEDRLRRQLKAEAANPANQDKEDDR